MLNNDFDFSSVAKGLASNFDPENLASNFDSDDLAAIGGTLTALGSIFIAVASLWDKSKKKRD